MSSFTFSSKLARHWRQARFLLLWFVLGFLLSAGAGYVVFLGNPAAQAVHEAVKDFPEKRAHSFNALFMGAIHQSVYFHNSYDVMSYVRKADVLILGHSRVMRGFDYEVTTKFFSKHKLKVYQLGMTHADGLTFAWEIFIRHNLRPGLVIINAENFFGRIKSKAYRRARKASTWEAYKLIKEKDAALWVVKKLNPFFPHLNHSLGSYNLIQRDLETGFWFPTLKRPERYPIINKQDRSPFRPHSFSLKTGKVFAQFLRSRGTEIVLTRVPSSTDDVSLAEIDQLAELMKAPLIDVESPDMETFDHSHLTDESSQLWSQMFFKEFSQLEIFQKLRRR